MQPDSLWTPVSKPAFLEVACIFIFNPNACTVLPAQTVPRRQDRHVSGPDAITCCQLKLQILLKVLVAHKSLRVISCPDRLRIGQIRSGQDRTGQALEDTDRLAALVIGPDRTGPDRRAGKYREASEMRWEWMRLKVIASNDRNGWKRNGAARLIWSF